MRELKFRAWHKGQKKMVPANLFKGIMNQDYPTFHIMQFTGKLDKNRKEIYEGDICRILYTDWTSNTDDSISLEDYLISISHTGIVVFSDLSFQIEMYNNKFNDHSLYSMHYGEHGFIEVIGNIYESNTANV